MLLEDKVAIVTGVGPGVGRATALALAREGARVGLVARTEERLDEVAAEIEALGGEAIACPASVTDAAQAKVAVERTVDAFGGLDIVVNSAFRAHYDDFEHADFDKWRKTYEVNVFGPLQLTQYAIPHLRARGGGSIVFVNSMSARKIRPFEGAYSTSKGALLVAVQAMAKELGPANIRVNTVAPGWIWGPNVQLYVEMEKQSRGVDGETVIAEITSNIPLGFIPPSEDIASAILFFASDLARSVTGQELAVNGGEYFHSPRSPSLRSGAARAPASAVSLASLGRPSARLWA
jgi:NAD(P)-dependent dehydrogenase (short-subunit alcohol dehydrogenase family)